MAEQVGKFLTELPELETPTDGDLMYIVDDETTSKKVTMANLKRVLGGNVTGTVEGASVSFSDGADGIPMEECEVTIVPIQTGSGTPSPSNIRPISGHTDVTVTVASTSGGSGEDTTVSLGRTVYKGWVNPTTGEGAITGASIQINPNDITFGGGFVRLLTTFSPITNDNVNEYLSSHFKSHLNASVASMENEFTIDGNKYMVLKSSMLPDLATAQSFFTNNTVELFGLLATPQTFNLTPTQVKTLLGQNYVSHDGGGNIKVVYIRDLDITINDLINRVTALENE